METITCKIVNVHFMPSTAVPVLEQGIKHGARPNNERKTLGGGNGSFVQVDAALHADILVEIEMPGMPNKVISLYSAFRDFSGHMRLTKQYADKVIMAAPSFIDVSFDASGRLILDDEQIRAWFYNAK